MIDKDLDNKIAIIGMAGRFPQADSIDQFWANLIEGKECISSVTDEELLAAGVPESLLGNSDYIKAAARISMVDAFDAEFFNFTPREAAFMDPQQRLLMECTYHALEDAGYAPSDNLAVTGIFVGVGNSSYFRNCLQQYQGDEDLPTQLLALMGNEKDYAATRIAYKLNLTGPSINVSTACSTSAVSVDLACKSLLASDCEIAVAGGAQVNVPQDRGYLYNAGSFHSKDGHVRTFDANSTGPVFGSGVGVVVLKRLEDAIRDGDHIYAVILGSAVNNDGAQKVGFTAPSVKGQASVIREALNVAQVDASSISYVEAHGTGTALGDLIEVSALTEVYRESTDRKQYCGIGSVKPNVGHLEVASGIASLIKTAKALKEGLIPASLNVAQPNPRIEFETSPFYINSTTQRWKGGLAAERRAAVSSFGIGGTNAHIILEGAESWSEDRKVVRQAPYLLPISARNKAALLDRASELLQYLRKEPAYELFDICFTACAGRRHFASRAAFVGDTSDALADQLHKFLLDGGNDITSSVPSAQGRPAFVFPGQGVHYHGMGRELHSRFKGFADAIDRCARILSERHNIDIEPIVLGERYIEDQVGAYAQSCIFAIEYAMATILIEWGIKPGCLIGHSLGEYAAATIAGVFSLQDALNLVQARSNLMTSLDRPGAMMVVNASCDRVAKLISGRDESIAIAAENGDEDVVLSGCKTVLEEVSLQLEVLRIRYKWLNVSGAFHSPLMKPILAAFRSVADRVEFRTPQYPVISGMTGQRAGDEIQTADYWIRHLHSQVSFRRAIQSVRTCEPHAVVEIGPKSGLLSLFAASDCFAGVPLIAPLINEEANGTKRFMSAVAQLYEAGCDPAWERVFAQSPGKRVPIPGYPFQRRSHWIDDSNAPAPHNRKASLMQPAKAMGRKTISARDGVTFFEKDVTSNSPINLQEHMVGRQMVWPAVAHMQMALTSAMELSGPTKGGVSLKEVMFVCPLVIQAGEQKTLQCIVKPSLSPGKFEFEIYSGPGAWTLHSIGQIVADVELQGASVKIDRNTTEAPGELDGARFYDGLRGRNIQYGPEFSRIRHATRVSEEEVFAAVDLGIGADALGISLGTLDSCLQTAGLVQLSPDDSSTQVPSSLECIDWIRKPKGRIVCRTKMRRMSNGEGSFDIDVIDEQGTVALRMSGLRTRPIAFSSDLRRPDLYQLAWTDSPDWMSKEPATSLAVVSASERIAATDHVLGEHPWVSITALSHAESDSAGGDFAVNQAMSHLKAADRIVLVADGECSSEAAVANYCGFRSLVQLCIKHDIRPSMGFAIVTAGAILIEGEPLRNPAQAVLHGASRTLSHEMYDMKACIIDVSAKELEAGSDTVVQACRHVRLGETVALRGGKIYSAQLRSFESRAIPSVESLRDDRTYLITGGLGGIGLRFAKRLSYLGAKHIVLISRRQPDSDQERAIRSIREMGTNVVILQVDVADRETLVAQLASVARDIPPFAGVIHAAGRVQDRMLVNQSTDDALVVFSSKITGAINLHMLMLDQPLEFFMLCSSTASLFGPPGQANYAAANSFLDAFAGWRRSQGMPAISVNWSGWRDVGMVANKAKNLNEKGGIKLLDPAEAVILGSDLTGFTSCSQIAVVDADWGAVASLLKEEGLPLARDVLKQRNELARASATSAGVTTNLRAEFEGLPTYQRKERVNTVVLESIADLLGRPAHSIDPNDNLVSLGVDSLATVSLRNSLNSRFGLALPVTLLYDLPVVSQLSSHIHAKLSADDNESAERLSDSLELEEVSRQELITLLEQELAP